MGAVQEDGHPESAEAKATGPDARNAEAGPTPGPDQQEHAPDQLPPPVPAGGAPDPQAPAPPPGAEWPLPPARNGAALSPHAPSPQGWAPNGSAAAQAPEYPSQVPAAAGAVPPPAYAPYPTPPQGPYAQGPYPQGPYPAAGPPVQPPPFGPYPQRARPQRRLAGWGAPAARRTHRWGLGAYLLAEAVFLLTSALVGWFVIGDGDPSVGSLLVALAVPTLLAAGTAVLITIVRGNGPRIDLNLSWSWQDVGLGLAFGFGGLVLTIPASLVYVSIVGEEASSAVGDVFGGITATPALALLVLVTVVIIAPTCEEILYRGLLWGGIEKIAGRWVAFVVSTLLFALAHFEFTRTPLLLVVAIPIAIARLYTGRLLASIVAHQINNLLPGVVLVLGLLGLMPAA